MHRRQFMQAAAVGVLGLSPLVSVIAAPAAGYRRLLILIELKGGNDGLNTLVPYADAEYYRLRPRLSIARDSVLQLSPEAGLNPALQPLWPLWEARELAVLQGVGYPTPNLSHFRSIEIWNTASRSDEVRTTGWLTRAFETQRPPREFFADGVRVGQGEMGPLAGPSARTIALANVEQFMRQSRSVRPGELTGSPALRHIMQVDQDIASAAQRINPTSRLDLEFPKGAFGDAVKTAAHVIESGQGVAALCLTLPGFDTHHNQQPTQTRLLQQLAEGLMALKTALVTLGRWDDTLILTCAEFGRRARENQSGGTDHGTANVHFACGGAVRGGLYGAAPSLTALDENGNLRHTLDFRSVYATVLNRWWGVDAAQVLGGRFREEAFLRA